MKNIQQITGDYGYGFLADVYSFVKNLSKNNIAVDTFMFWMQIEREAREAVEADVRAATDAWWRKYEANAPRCEVCGKTLMLEAINNNPRRMIGGTGRSWWVCPDTLCEADPVIDEREPYVLLAKLGVPAFRSDPEVEKFKLKRARAAARRRRGCGKRRTKK